VLVGKRGFFFSFGASKSFSMHPPFLGPKSEIRKSEPNPTRNHLARLAQSVERETLNLKVAGSTVSNLTSNGFVEETNIYQPALGSIPSTYISDVQVPFLAFNFFYFYEKQNGK
jgi:hypothetical protein